MTIDRSQNSKRAVLLQRVLPSFPTFRRLSAAPLVKYRTAIRQASYNGYLHDIQLLFQDPCTAISSGHDAIINACQQGHHKLVRVLLDDYQIDPSVRNNQAIVEASTNGHLKVVKMLLRDSRVDPSTQRDSSLRWAVGMGHWNIVRRLLRDDRVDPSTQSNQTIEGATWYGHKDIVQKLLKDHRTNSLPWVSLIETAKQRGHEEILQALVTAKPA